VNRLICVLVMSLHLAGCTTLSAVPYSRETFEKEPVRKGDEIIVKTTGARIQVTSVTPEQICGEHECVRAEAIESFERQEFSALKTAALMAGIVLIVVAAMTLHYAPAIKPGTCFFCSSP
jgi:hypothetical protein